MLAVDAVAALQALIPLQIQAQAPMVVVQPQQIPPHHQVLQLTLIGLINNQTIQMMILALDIIQDAIIHSIVTAIGFESASADWDPAGGTLVSKHKMKLTRTQLIPLTTLIKQWRHQLIWMTQVTRIITMVTTAMTTSHTAISHTTDIATGFVDAIADIDG
jgi:hypothetical protein